MTRLTASISSSHYEDLRLLNKIITGMANGVTGDNKFNFC
jgi:hypothetical protein